ncbi:MAG: hypothetical protein J0H00_15850 [Burkholderiales bacterium]|mgnify:CR=1 FL=1|nr:hypothetical protein [Burkholderiales bacterium]
MSAISIDDQIACVLRELRMRESVYPRWIGTGKVTAEKSAHELACMRAVLDTLQALKREREPGLFE